MWLGIPLYWNWQLECVVVACSSGRMEYIGWLLGSSRAPVSDQLRKDAPNGLVLHGDLRDVSNTAARSTSVETNVYEHVADTCNTFVADLPFLVNGLVDACGVVLPYFEVTCQLATRNTELWVGFLNVGGAELKRGGPAHIGFDIFDSFEVGDVIGIGIFPKTRKLFISKNGELLKGELVSVDPKSVKELPAARVRGVCKFSVNFGDSAAFAFSPYTYSVRTSSKEVSKPK